MPKVFLVGLGLIVLMLVFNRIFLKEKPGISEFAASVQPDSHWGNNKCACGTERDDWRIVAVNKIDFKYLLKCPQCNTYWEETMAAGGQGKWRQVDETYIKYHYSHG